MITLAALVFRDLRPNQAMQPTGTRATRVPPRLIANSVSGGVAWSESSQNLT